MQAVKLENQKLDNQLNLAIDLTNDVRENSQELNTGYDKATNRWELIVKYSGDISRYETE